MIYAVVALTLCSVFWTFALCKINNKRYTTLQDPTFRAIYGKLYENLRLRSRKAAKYLITQTLRRLSFVALIIFMRGEEKVGLQWVLVMIFVSMLPSISALAIRVNLAHW